MNVEIVVNTLSFLVMAVAVTWFICWVSTFYRLPEGYSLTREPHHRGGHRVTLHNPNDWSVTDFRESIYGQRGAINSARREAHKHKKLMKKSDAVYQARFEKKFGGDNES